VIDRGDIVKLEAKWVLGLLIPEAIPEIAQDALVEGASSPTVLELAICKPDEKDAISKLFLRYLAESGAGSMSKQDALRHYAREISASILSDKITAYDGAKLLWQASINAGETGFHEIDPFIYAASEMEERPNDWDFFVTAIRDEARRWYST
jgi:hypothetical protein